jgi:hypothetical protein
MLLIQKLKAVAGDLVDFAEIVKRREVLQASGISQFSDSREHLVFEWLSAQITSLMFCPATLTGVGFWIVEANGRKKSPPVRIGHF